MKRILCTKASKYNEDCYTLGRIYETDDNYLNAVADNGNTIYNTSLLTESASTFVEIPCVGDKILIKDGSKIEDYICNWSNKMESFVNQLFTFDTYYPSYSIDRKSINQIGFYTKEMERQFIFDSRSVNILGNPEKIEEEEQKQEKLKNNPLSLVKSGGLVVRRDGSKAIILECKKGLYLAAKDLTKYRDLSDYETNGDCKSLINAFDIIEIYDLDDNICDFEIRNRKLLWKRKSIEVEKIEKEINEHEIIITVLKNKLQKLIDN